MTVIEMNQLRPGDRVIFELRGTQTKGTVLSVWRDDRVMIEWSDRIKDSLAIDDENAKLLRRYVLSLKRQR